MKVKVVGKYTLPMWGGRDEQVIVQFQPLVPFRDKFDNRRPTFEIPLDYSESQPELGVELELVPVETAEGQS